MILKAAIVGMGKMGRIRKKGVDFDFNLPIEKPGGYFVRAGFKDQVSGKIGKTEQFLEIPDLGKNRLALSSIFVVLCILFSATKEIVFKHNNLYKLRTCLFYSKQIRIK